VSQNEEEIMKIGTRSERQERRREDEKLEGRMSRR
jgi:hypothetical protein